MQRTWLYSTRKEPFNACDVLFVKCNFLPALHSIWLSYWNFLGKKISIFDEALSHILILPECWAAALFRSWVHREESVRMEDLILWGLWRSPRYGPDFLTCSMPGALSETLQSLLWGKEVCLIFRYNLQPSLQESSPMEISKKQSQSSWFLLPLFS